MQPFDFAYKTFVSIFTSHAQFILPTEFQCSKIYFKLELSNLYLNITNISRFCLVEGRT